MARIAHAFKRCNGHHDTKHTLCCRAALQGSDTAPHRLSSTLRYSSSCSTAFSSVPWSGENRTYEVAKDMQTTTAKVQLQ